MCGISGIIDLKGHAIDVSKVEHMTRLVQHRGPDGESFYFNKNIGLGHRLLSITGNELSGTQPLVDPSGNYVIVFNGEIFNYKDLKKDLEKKGHRFCTETDTEVVLKSYIAFGEKMVEQFNGMWALAIIDFTKQQLFLS